MATLDREARAWPTPAVTVYAEAKASPFEVLVATILSLRTRDEATAAASARLFALARTPEAILALDEATIAEAIRPAGFYRTKARTLREISGEVLARWGGRVPDDVDELTTLKGVGRKTANLVVSLGHGLPAICVDTHVHRICNRWGYLRTKTPDETETRLREILPRRFWIPINDRLVALGQNVCKPISPLCSKCALAGTCARIGVGKSR